MSPRDLLKQATKFKKEGKIQEAINSLEKAYETGVYEPSNVEVMPDEYVDFDKLIGIVDLVRKAKYLQELGKINDSLNYIDWLINEELPRSSNNGWVVLDLSELFNHKAIILKKEKRYNDEFIARVKSYCLAGISHNMNIDINPKSFKKKLKTQIDPTNIEKFIDKMIKKVTLNFDKRQLTGLIQVIITQDFKINGFDNKFKKLLNEN